MLLVLGDQQLLVFVGRDKGRVSVVFVGSGVLLTPQSGKYSFGNTLHFARFRIATFEQFSLPCSWVNDLRWNANFSGRTLPISTAGNHLAERFWIGPEKLVLNYQVAVVVPGDGPEGLLDGQKTFVDHSQIDKVTVSKDGHTRLVNAWINSNYNHWSPP